jgi:hypothetical protein
MVPEEQDCAAKNEIYCLLFLHFCLFVAMGFFFLSHIPESFACSHRRFDVIGHSHQFWHISITLAMMVAMKAASLDINLGYRTQEEIDVLETFCSMWWAAIITFTINITITCFCVRRIKFLATCTWKEGENTNEQLTFHPKKQ